MSLILGAIVFTVLLLLLLQPAPKKKKVDPSKEALKRLRDALKQLEENGE